MQRIIRHRIKLLTLLLAVAPLAFSACGPEPEVIEISVQSDFSQLVAALEDVDASLSQRMALLEAAVESGLADNQAAVALARQAVQSLRGDLEDKLAAVSEAVKSQGTSLETKLALIEAAISTGFADAQAQRALLQEAVASLGGSLDEKVASLETAVKSQSTALETKLGLVEAAVKDGLADNETAQGLLKEAIASLGGTMQDKLAAIDAALVGQQVALSAKLSLVETALAEGFAEGKTRQELLLRALDSLGGNPSEKLSAIDSALASQTAGLATKLTLIEAALTNGLSSGAAALQQIRTALTALKGAVDGKEEKIDAIIAALGEMDPATGSVSEALSRMLVSVDTASDYDTMLKNILRNVELLLGTINGHAFVEMGDGLRWATCNIGATNPQDCGDFFAWGETETKTTFTWANYKWMQAGKDSLANITKYTYADRSNEVFKNVIWYDGDTFVGDNKKTFADCNYEDDAARKNWGSTWRIPTCEELEWLKDNTHCDWVWTADYQGTGVKGMLVKSKIPGYENNSIFLPIGGFRKDSGIEQSNLGYYWSSSLREASYDGGCLDFGIRETDTTPILFIGCNDRYLGSLLRPVSD